MEFKTWVLIIAILLFFLWWKMPQQFDLLKNAVFEQSEKLWDKYVVPENTLNKIGLPKCTNDEQCKTLSECQNIICKCNLQDGYCYS